MFAGANFVSELSKTWEIISHEYSSNEEAASLAMSDVERLSTQNSYHGLTTKQSLYKVGIF